MEATKKILRVLLPTLGAVKGAAVFNAAIRTGARGWSPALREAAYADSIVLDELQGTLDRLSGATTFEDQQDAISDALAAANEAIDRVSDGTVTRLEKSLRPLPILLRQIREQAASMVDVFRPDAAKIETIRKATAQVVPIVEAEMRASNRGEDAHAVVRHLEHSTRLLGSRHYQVREAAAHSVVECIDRLAA